MVPTTGEIVWSFCMLTVNADDDPVMRRFRRLDDERRSVVVLEPGSFLPWLHGQNSIDIVGA